MIPKVIHYCWFSGEKKPKRVNECIQTWNNVLTDYEIKEWTLKDFDSNIIPFVSKAIHYKKWAFAADYFRLWVLYNYGGIYLDCDVIVNRSFDEVLTSSLFLGWEDLDCLEAHAIGSIQDHNWLKLSLEYYEKINIVDVSDFYNYLMPQVITQNSVNNFKLNRNFKQQSLMNNIMVYPINYFTLNLNDERNICEHLFLGSWNDTSSYSYKDHLMSNYYKIYNVGLKRNLYFFKRFIKSIVN